MIAFTYGIGAAIAFMLLFTSIAAWIEMKFDQRSTIVFDADDTRTEDELKIIHEYYLPMRALALVMITLAADMQEVLLWLALFFACLCYFWIVFDILCAVVWLGKPWWYVGEPPPLGIDPKLFFLVKLILLVLCLYIYVKFSYLFPPPVADVAEIPIQK